MSRDTGEGMNTTVQAAGLDGQGRCSCTALRKASRRVSQLYDIAMLRGGVSINQRGILAQIGRSVPLTVGKLAEALVMDPGALAHNLKPLERDGLTTVTVDPNDRRRRLIALTAAGRTKLAETDALWAEAQRSFEAAFSQVASETLRAALQVLVTGKFTDAFHSALAAGIHDTGSQVGR
jgi:DNA-binding MarR family transcriptional regulator